MPADDDGRDGGGDVLQMGARRDGRDQDDAVHAAVDHRLGDPGLGLLAVAARAQEDLVVGVRAAGR